MEPYSVVIKPSAAKELEAIPLKKDRQRLAVRIQTLSSDPRPHGCEKLHIEDCFRIRQGSYRIVYSIDDTQETVPVVKIGHRKDVYR